MFGQSWGELLLQKSNFMYRIFRSLSQYSNIASLIPGLGTYKNQPVEQQIHVLLTLPFSPYDE